MSNTYQQDFFKWVETTANLLRSRDFEKIDYDNLIEELETLGRSEKRALKSNLVVILVHILKWTYQPDKRCGSWSGSIREHQRRIAELLEDSPSLKNYVPEVFDGCYREAVLQASLETGLPIETFPSQPVLSLQDSLNKNYTT